MKRDLKRKLIGGLCLTSIAFVFQACYGTPQDFGSDLLIEGEVKAKSTGLPINVGLMETLLNTNFQEAKEQIQYYRKGKISEEERNILKEMKIRIDQLDFDEAEILMKRWEGME